MSLNFSKQINLFDTDILTLIKEVKQRECLWNKPENIKGDRNQASRAWGEISDILDIPSDACRSKWRNLRDVFRREMRREPISDLEQYRGTWKFFRPLWFLHRPDDPDDEVVAQPVHFIKHEPAEYLDDEDPLPERPKRRKRGTDSDILFLKSLAPYLQQLDPLRKLVVRNKLQQVLIDELSSHFTGDAELAS